MPKDDRRVPVDHAGELGREEGENRDEAQKKAEEEDPRRVVSMGD